MLPQLKHTPPPPPQRQKSGTPVYLVSSIRAPDDDVERAVLLQRQLSVPLLVTPAAVRPVVADDHLNFTSIGENTQRNVRSLIPEKTGIYTNN